VGIEQLNCYCHSASQQHVYIYIPASGRLRIRQLDPIWLLRHLSGILSSMSRHYRSPWSRPLWRAYFYAVYRCNRV